MPPWIDRTETRRGDMVRVNGFRAKMVVLEADYNDATCFWYGKSGKPQTFKFPLSVLENLTLPLENAAGLKKNQEEWEASQRR